MYNKSLLAIIFVLCFSSILVGQDRLQETFYNYEVLSIDSKAEVARTTSGFFETTIDIPQREISWVLDLRVSNIISDDYFLRIQTDEGITTKVGTTAVPTQGYLKDNPDSRVSLTFNEGFIYGYIEEGNEVFFIEPLSYFDSKANHDEYIFYSQSDLKPGPVKTCGTDMKKHAVHDPGDVEAYGSRVGECFEVDWAIANDGLMFQSYGSVAGVENHAIGVANNVQTNYDDEFADEIQFVIPGQFISTSTSQDPWTNNTDAGTLLTNFRNWGPGGFGFTHDIGSLWTDRNFDGSTIGIAFLGVVCTGSRYNCLQDFTNNASFKRVMVSHEIGHNFDADHDGSGSGFIMAPSVNNTNSWSTASRNSINAHIASRNCLATCIGGTPTPTADFTFNQLSDCVVAEAEFFDNSTGNDLEYEWSVPGAVPSFSTEQNPIFSFPLAGVYSVTLTVTNSGGQDSHTENSIITVQDIPDISFGFSTNMLTTEFTNFTTGATSFVWDFGDGATSIEDNPTHTYEEDGTYFVVLVASNECGNIQEDQQVTIATPPIPDFENTNPVGCEGHTVSFFNLSSSNTQTIEWTFEGGDPESSAENNVDVTYATAGIYDVKLTAFNPQGEIDKIEEALIEIIEAPQASFTTTIDGNTVICNNTSTNAGNYFWNFGDGNTSMESNPTHTYDMEGTFTISLTATGSSECDDGMATEVVQITLLPNASFNVSAGATSGCDPLEVQFNNTSSNSPTSYMWTFEGGSPATSIEDNPLVTYNNPGTYDVQLIAINGNGNDTSEMTGFIEVFTGPVAATIDAMTDDLTVNLNANSANANSFMWNFGDGNTGSGATTSHSYAIDGTYEVELTVSNECGESTSTSTVQAFSQVTASFSQGMSSICENNTIQFTNMSSDNADTFLWTFEGGMPATSTDQNPLVTYENAGIFDVSLVVSNPLFMDDVNMVDAVTVDGALNPTYDVIEDGLTLTFDGSSDASTVSWDFGDGNNSAEPNPTHTYSQEGIYTVTYTVTNSCGSYTEIAEFNLYTQVTAGISASTNGGCAPQTIMFTDDSSENTTAWSWTFEGAEPSTSIEQNPSASWASPGIYTVTLIASNPASMESITMMIEILDVVEVSFDSFREELQVSFTNTSTGGGDTYAWDFGDGNLSSEENPTHTYAVEGEYEVTLTITNECGSSTSTQSVIASALPSANYASSGTSGCLPYTVTFTDASSSNVTAWNWTFEGGTPATSTDQNPEVTYNNVGSYDVSLIVTAPAGSDEKVDMDAITIIDVPLADFDYSTEGTLVTFNYEGEDAEILWDFGDGRISDLKEPIHNYDADGLYKVTMTATNDCGTTTVEQEILINTVSVDDIESFAFNIYPNPATEYITLESSVQKLNVTILNTTGQIVKNQIVSSGNKLDTSNLIDGTYIIKVHTEDNKIGFKKLLIFR